MCALFVTITFYTEGAKILGIFHMTAYSHYQLGDRILKELAERGHEVTVITPFAEKEPTKNFKTVVLTGLVEEHESMYKRPITYKVIINYYSTIFREKGGYL